MNRTYANIVALAAIVGVLVYCFPLVKSQYSLWVDIKKATPWTQQFSPQNIYATCANVKDNSYYLNCFIPKATAFLDEEDLGPSGVILVGLAGTSTLNIQRPLRGDAYTNLTTRLFAIHLWLFTLDRLVQAPETSEMDTKIKTEIRQKAILAADNEIRQAKMELSRLPASTGLTQLGTTLKNYENTLSSYR